MGQLPTLLPYGGAAGLVIYLLWLIVGERTRWTEERKSLRAEHRQELDDRSKWQHERIDELEADLRETREEVRQLRNELRDRDGL